MKVELVDRDYFKNPFTKDEIKALLRGSKASDMFNFRSPGFSKLGLDREKLSDEDLIGLMLKEPRLIKRPIVKIGRTLYFAASAERLADIIGY